MLFFRFSCSEITVFIPSGNYKGNHCAPVVLHPNCSESLALILIVFDYFNLGFFGLQSLPLWRLIPNLKP